MVPSQVRPAERSGTVGGPPPVEGLAVAVLVGFTVGVLTAYGQDWLSGSTGPLANSAGPWSVAAFLVARYNRQLVAAVTAAVLTLVCCELGYVLATVMRDGSNATSTVVFWLTAALLAGPPLGVAGRWSRGSGLRRQVGFGVIGGVVIGEGVYGWTTLADTTDWRYWAFELLIGIGFLVALAARSMRLRDALVIITIAALTAMVVLSVARST